MKNRIEGHPNLFKDSETGVITSRDEGERQKYRYAKHAAVDQLQQKHEIDKMNIRQATLHSMHNSISKIVQEKK